MQSFVLLEPLTLESELTMHIYNFLMLANGSSSYILDTYTSYIILPFYFRFIIALVLNCHLPMVFSNKLNSVQVSAAFSPHYSE